jgi:hypothetical protein
LNNGSNHSRVEGPERAHEDLAEVFVTLTISCNGATVASLRLRSVLLP